ncbi:phosphotransferase family protein [Hyaloscypha finlandica]|nr:phosphotransferase family protein [Hyaloscypha finlandica]
MADASCSRNTNDENDRDISKGSSAKAKLNQAVLERLQAAIKASPEIELFSEFPRIYKGAAYEQKHASMTPVLFKRDHPKGKPPGPANFCADLVARARNAEIVYALSDEARKFLSSYIEPESGSELIGSSLLSSLSQMILSCERLWEFPTRGVVLKCNANLIAKIIHGNNDYTEYTSIQYLAAYAPEIPAPRPHGLVKFDSVRILFMTYFPSMTLESAWPNLLHEDKVSIQKQLNDIFIKLRSLTGDGPFLGGVNGEGAKDNHRESHMSREIISTVAQFEDFQFSIPPHDGSSWVKFLRSLLPPALSTTVFTHGDVRPANTMVDINESGKYLVTGIIDWETSGFYPDYFEPAKILFLFPMDQASDWWQYLLPCIAPARNPERWLVSRLWDITVTEF